MIVEAASRLFLESGYHATSIGQIATEAGVAVQTIYNTIGSKRDLSHGCSTSPLPENVHPLPSRNSCVNKPSSSPTRAS